MNNNKFGTILSQTEQDFQQWLYQQQKEIADAQAEINRLKCDFEEQARQLENEKKQLLHKFSLKSQQKQEVYDDHSKFVSENQKLQREIQEISQDFDLRDQYINLLQQKKEKLILEIKKSAPAQNLKQELEIYETLYGMHFRVSVIDKQLIHKIISKSGNSWITFTFDQKQLTINEAESKFPLSLTEGNLLTYCKSPLKRAINSFNSTFDWPSFLLFLSTYLK